MSGDRTTHFGYQQVALSHKTTRVGEVFHSVAQNYDLMNDLMSFGIHRLWKRFAVELSGVRQNHQVLDIAGGTGDLAQRFSKIVGPYGQIILADINASMLSVGRDRLLDAGYVQNIRLVQANAEALPFADNSFDCISIGFGLRNVTEIDKALRSMYRVLKPGGRLIILEFSQPTSPWLNRLYDAYSFSILPKIGSLVAKDEASYQYLAESIRMHPNQAALKSMLDNSGFARSDYHNLTGGIVAIHRGFKF